MENGIKFNDIVNENKVLVDFQLTKYNIGISELSILKANVSHIQSVFNKKSKVASVVDVKLLNGDTHVFKNEYLDDSYNIKSNEELFLFFNDLFKIV